MERAMEKMKTKPVVGLEVFVFLALFAGIFVYLGKMCIRDRCSTYRSYRDWRDISILYRFRQCRKRNHTG